MLQGNSPGQFSVHFPQNVGLDDDDNGDDDDDDGDDGDYGDDDDDDDLQYSLEDLLCLRVLGGGGEIRGEILLTKRV